LQLFSCFAIELWIRRIPESGQSMKTAQALSTWLRSLIAFVAAIAILSGCGDTAAEDCEGCSNLELKPACEAAAAECDAVPADSRQTCIHEARALCS
jgi:hypothetical protein